MAEVVVTAKLRKLEAPRTLTDSDHKKVYEAVKAAVKEFCETWPSGVIEPAQTLPFTVEVTFENA